MQTVPDVFHQAAQGSIIPIDWGLRISFTKEFDDDVTFFILNTSILNGLDVLAPSDDNSLQQWDKYDYEIYDDRVVDMEWSRELSFPYSVHSALADITLNNYDDYFSPNSGSPIASYILPKRPIRILAGYKNASTVPQLVGLTQGMPEIDETSKTASFHILDFLSEMYSLNLSKTIAMQNVTTDVVLAAIFEQFGLSSAQYSLAKGRNKIPFLFFEKDTNAGNIFQQLMQAEMGSLWLNESGIIRFDERLSLAQDPVMIFDEHNIVDIKNTDKDNIINNIDIRSNIRKVQEFQPIFSSVQSESALDQAPSDGSFVVPANSTRFYTPEASLSDPAISATVPTVGVKTNTSWFTAVTEGGAPVGSNVSITFAELHTNSYTMLFSNTNSFPVVINQIEVWGEPAKIVDTIRYTAYDEVSVEKYGTIKLGGDEGITNDFFGSVSNCESFADYVLDAYKEYAGQIEIEAKGDLALQLGDPLLVDYESFSGNYRIVKTAAGLKKGTMTVTAQRYTPREWFVLDQSILNGTDVLAP